MCFGFFFFFIGLKCVLCVSRKGNITLKALSALQSKGEEGAMAISHFSGVCVCVCVEGRCRGKHLITSHRPTDTINL